MTTHEIEELVANVTASTKYRHIDPCFIRSIGARELSKHQKLKDAIKSTKNKLHQVAGAYQGTPRHYDTWLDQLRLAEQNPEQLKDVAVEIMRHHTSTRERLPLLNDFYTRIFQELPPVHSILDIACGFNPLSIPWMPIDSIDHYLAYDIFDDMMDFLAQALSIMHIPGEARTHDVIHAPPQEKVDVAFLFKAIPCLEQVDRTIGTRLMRAINASYLIVSFPVQSLGGHTKGMAQNYERAFQEMIEDPGWHAQKLLFSTELVFIVDKS